MAINYKSVLYAKLTILIVNLAVKHFPLLSRWRTLWGRVGTGRNPWQEWFQLLVEHILF